MLKTLSTRHLFRPGKSTCITVKPLVVLHNFRDHLRDDLLKIARTTLGSKILSQHSEHFSRLAVDAIMRLKGSDNLDAIQVIKKLGGSMDDSYLDEGFLLEKKPGMYQPQRIEKAKILIANTPMDTDKVKVFGSRVRVDSVAKVAEIEAGEREKMKQKVGITYRSFEVNNCFDFRLRRFVLTESMFSSIGS